MEQRNYSTKSTENLDTGNEAGITTPLPPPSPTGYEHCFLTRRNRDDDSGSAPFTTKVISYLPTRPQTLPLDATDISALTRSQRDVLHHILEDRNGRTEENGLWVLVGLLGAGAVPEGGESEDFEISIMFCEYGASVDPHFDHSKRFYLSTTSTSNKDNARAQEPQENTSNEHPEKERMAGAKMGKGMRFMGQEYANFSQGQNSMQPVPDKDTSLPDADNSENRGTAPPQTKDQSFGGVRIPEKDSGEGSSFSASRGQPNESFEGNSERKREPRSETFPLPGARQMNDEGVQLSSPSPLPANPQAAVPPCEASSAIRPEQIETERLPTLNSSQLVNTHSWASKLRIEGDFDEAISLFHIVWYCREILFGPSHPWTINTMQHLAATYEEISEFEIAATLREELATRDPQSTSGKSAELVLPPTVSELLEVQQWAVELRRQGAFNKAIWLLTIVWYAFDTIVGEENGNSRNAMNELALTYDAYGQPDTARRLRGGLEERRQRNKFQNIC